MKKERIFLFISILLLSAQNILAYDFYTKEIHKGFLYKENMKLHISNQYGDINIVPAQQDSITLDIIISVEHFDEEKANNLLDEVNVNFSQVNNTAKSETIISKLFKTGLKFRIDYIVKTPSTVTLDINNVFGNIRLEGVFNRETKINLKYGDLSINKITTQDTTQRHLIKLKYSSAIIDNCDNLKLNSSYSKIKINESKQLIIASNFSKLELGMNNYVIANCEHDSYFIKQTESANILKGLKSNITINKLNNAADINLKDGDINLNTKNSFTSISLNTDNVNAVIKTDISAKYFFQVKSQNSIIKYPIDAQIISTEKDTIRNIESVKGILGDMNNVNASINIICKKGNVEIL